MCCSVVLQCVLLCLLQYIEESVQVGGICVILCCSVVLQCVLQCVLQYIEESVLQVGGTCVILCCSVVLHWSLMMECVAVCVAVYVAACVAVCVAVLWCSILKRVCFRSAAHLAYWSLLMEDQIDSFESCRSVCFCTQCVVVCCSVL